MIGGEGGTRGPFFGVSQASVNSILCLPGIIGGGGPKPFFLIVVLVVLI